MGRAKKVWFSAERSCWFSNTKRIFGYRKGSWIARYEFEQIIVALGKHNGELLISFFNDYNVDGFTNTTGVIDAES